MVKVRVEKRYLRALWTQALEIKEQVMRAPLSSEKRSITPSIITWGVSDELGCAMRVTKDVGAFAETGGGTEEWVVLRS